MSEPDGPGGGAFVVAFATVAVVGGLVGALAAHLLHVWLG